MIFLNVNIFFVSSIILIIGLPTYFSGCSSKGYGYCQGFIKKNARVVDNNCKLTNLHDDYADVGFNCRVHFQYLKDDHNVTCHLYRSDSDFCEGVVNWKQVNKCNKLNIHDYPVNTYHQIFINKINGRCQSPHINGKITTVGLVFLILSCICLIIAFVGIIINCYKRSVNRQINNVVLNVKNTSNYIEIVNPINHE